MIDDLDAIDGPARQVAARLRDLSGIEPSPAVVARIRTALLTPTSQERQAAPARHFTPWRRPAVSLAFAAMLVAVGTTSVFAAPGALPDSPLYAVRNLKETLQVQLAATRGQRATLYASFATERSAQLRALASQRHPADPSVVQTLLRDITSRVQEANQEANGDGQEARAAVRQAEGQIASQLNQIQQDGNLPSGQDDSLNDTIRAVQSGPSGPSGQSGDGTGNDNANQP